VSLDFTKGSTTGFSSSFSLRESGIDRRRESTAEMSPFPRKRSLQRVLDDAYARFYTNPFEEWWGGLWGRFRR